MSISSISSTQSQPVSGLIAPLYPRHKKGLSESTVPAFIAPTDSSTNNASQLAAAVAAALTQLGLTAAPNAISVAATAVTATSGSSDTDAKGNAPLAQQPPQKGLQQVQQYRNVASTFSNLAQALASSSSNVSSTSSGSSNLTTVFQNLWTSLGASSATSSDSSSSTIPSLQSFLQTVAQNLSESGISGLRGVFVDTVA